MTYKEKLSFLNGYRDAMASVKDTADLIRTLREKAESTTPNLDGLPHGSGVSDKVGKAAAEIADLEVQLLEEKAESFMRLAKIERVIFNLQGRDRQLIQLKYIDGKSWEEVADALNYDMFYLMKVRRRIVNGLKI